MAVILPKTIIHDINGEGRIKAHNEAMPGLRRHKEDRTSTGNFVAETLLMLGPLNRVQIHALLH
jgi:hypothetical protein